MGTAGSGITVAVAGDFLSAFARIPRKQQSKVLEFIRKFRTDPTMPGIHYEKIQQARDPNLRSVRIDQAYRGIVLRPEAGNVYLLLWVDHHDEAYRWAVNKLCDVHPETGSLQIYDVEEAAGAPPAAPAASAVEEGLFAGVRDRHLLRLGVPEPLLPMVRALVNEDDLDQAAARLPQEAYEALSYLAAGFSLEEVIQELERVEVEAPVDTGNFAAALERPDSRRRFYVVADDLELQAILSAPLERWRVFLHPTQRKLVERHWNGPVRVLGGAGTGKTVAAMHRARWLAETVFTAESDRILFTTFTRNLAADIRENLAKICSREAMRRIEVVNLDRWVSGFLRRNGYSYEIDYGRRSDPLWERAVALIPSEPALDPAFYREEWDRVIQPQAIGSLEAYLTASRVGRGVRLSRKDRKTIWPIFEEYRVLLNERGLREADDAMRDARILLEGKGDILPYRAIIVDEAQDMGPQAFRLIRQMVPGGECPDDLFIAGDAHQRIYRHKVVLGRCGINIRGRGRKLRINYRTTDETRRWAVGLLTGVSVDDLDGGLDDQKGYKALLHGVDPELHPFDSFQEEVGFIADYLGRGKGGEEALKGVCLVTPTNSLLDQYESALRDRGLPTYRVHRSEAEDRKAPGLRLATMHRVKGLEFDRVIIAAVNEGVIPHEGATSGSSDPVIRRDTETHERSLLYVAATRAKEAVIITSFGRRSPFLDRTSGAGR